MNAKEHARKMLVKRNHPDHSPATGEKPVAVKPKKEAVVGKVTETIETPEEVVETPVEVTPRKAASKKKAEVETDD